MRNENRPRFPTTPGYIMTLLQRLLPLALLSFASYDSRAAGNGGIEPYSPSVAPLTASATLASQYAWRGIRQSDGRAAAQFSDGRVAGSGNGGMDWHDLKAGLSRRFEGGWALSGTYSRAFGAGAEGAFDRYANAMPRTDLRPLPGSKSRSGALVMTLSRRF